MKIIDLVSEGAPYRDKLYQRYQGIKARCYYPSDKNYPNYGGRGIKLCKEWKDNPFGFLYFYGWAMSSGFSPELTLERIDVDGDYEPSNCEWIPPADQIHNRRCSIRIWDEDRYISMKTYCNIHKDTNPYKHCLKQVHKGVPPIIALYCQFDGLTMMWLQYSHSEELLNLLLDVVKAHPNLIDNKDIPVECWANNYLSQTY